MLFFLVSFIPFLLLITKPLSIHLPSWVNEIRLLSFLLFQESLCHSIEWIKSYKIASTHFLIASSSIFRSKIAVLNIENVNLEQMEEEEEEKINLEAKMNILDMPELALDLILEKLSPNGLLNIMCVCTHLREKCKSNYFWERHFSEKWGRIIGEAAKKEWKNYINSVKDYKKIKVKNSKSNWLSNSLSCIMPCSWLRKCESEVEIEKKVIQVDSIMAFYLALENGRFWFPAQVYNREQSAHVGFLLSCYDAELSYDSHSDTFHARYPPHGQRTSNVEEGVGWGRLRAPPTHTQAHQLHASDCLKELKPNDHIEIQWRRNKEFPYGWWYGVVGHLEQCDRDELHCECYNSDRIILEFNQYSIGSRWRKTVVKRKDHREDGNESDGFYGGIRKLYDRNEIYEWKKIWPSDVLE